VADPKPSLLERILGTECPEGCVLGTGLPCMGPASHMTFCASRIRAAEEAETVKPRVRHKWEQAAEGWRCAKCDVLFSSHPGPCPARTSTDATKGDGT
jgi:hypothetical protein